MNEVTRKAKLAKQVIKSYFPTTEEKNKLLLRMADALEANHQRIIEANKQDLMNGRKSGTSKALLDRIALNINRIKDIAEGLRQISQFPDPIGEVIEAFERPNGLKMVKKRVPLGVIGMIYEARPNVTVDAAGLCLKTGNAVVLRGGSAALQSNMVIVQILHETMRSEGFPEDYIQFIEDADRASVTDILTCHQYVDVLIPRGGKSLIQHVVQNAVVPVIETGEGVCSVYIHEDADLEQATSIVINAKCQRPSVCNAIETVLIDQSIATEQLPKLADALKERGVQLRGCEDAKKIVPWIDTATEEDWSTEYLDLILSVKVVEDVGAAITHINQYGTMHSESIITTNQEAADRFMREVDAAAVYHNASTRFTDGFEFGFGAEIGISTQKLHARGPMGLKELTSSKYYIYGEGQIRE